MDVTWIEPKSAALLGIMKRRHWIVHRADLVPVNGILSAKPIALTDLQSAIQDIEWTVNKIIAEIKNP